LRHECGEALTSGKEEAGHEVLGGGTGEGVWGGDLMVIAVLLQVFFCRLWQDFSGDAREGLGILALWGRCKGRKRG
jgi:hypothetical protein